MPFLTNWRKKEILFNEKFSQGSIIINSNLLAFVDEKTLGVVYPIADNLTPNIPYFFELNYLFGGLLAQTCAYEGKADQQQKKQSHFFVCDNFGHSIYLYIPTKEKYHSITEDLKALLPNPEQIQNRNKLVLIDNPEAKLKKLQIERFEVALFQQ